MCSDALLDIIFFQMLEGNISGRSDVIASFPVINVPKMYVENEEL